jgi:hypothetical protein
VLGQIHLRHALAQDLKTARTLLHFDTETYDVEADVRRLEATRAQGKENILAFRVEELSSPLPGGSVPNSMPEA